MSVNAIGAVLPETGAGQNYVATGSAGSSRSGSKKNDIFYALPGETLSGFEGDDSYYVWDARTRVVELANGGIDTLYVNYWGSVTLDNYVENVIVTGLGTNLITGNNSANLIKIGATGAMVNAGGGNDVIVGGAGADVFVMAAGNGSDAIENFKPGWDVVKLSGYGFGSFDALLAKSQQTGSDVTVTLASSEKLVLRDVALGALTAADFDLPMTVTVPSSGTTHLYKGGQAWNSNGWYVHNNVWGAANLVEGTDYNIESHFNLGNMTDGTTFAWSFPLTTEVYPAIRAYPHLIFGASPANGANAVNPTDTALVLPALVGDLKSLTATHDVAFAGNLAGFNVSYDIWLTSTANGGMDAVTNEVMIWVHKGSFEAFGEQVGTYADGNGHAAKIYHSGTYTAVVFETEMAAAKIDIKAIFDTLEQLGIVNDSEYVRSIEMGAEVTSGSGTLRFNNLDIEVSTKTADGGTLTKLVTGTGTTVTETSGLPATPPADPIAWWHDVAAGTTALKDVFGKASGNQITTVNKGVIETIVTNSFGRIVSTDKATIAGNTMTIDEYDGNGKLVGRTVEAHNSGGVTWLQHFDAKGVFVGAERTLVESGVSVVNEVYNANWAMTSAERVVTKVDGSTTTQLYGAGYTFLGLERTSTKADGSVMTQFFTVDEKVTGSEVVTRTATDVRTFHYDAKGQVKTIDVVQNLGNGVVKEVTVDGKWNGLHAELHGSDGADVLWGSSYTTDFFGGLGRDVLGGGAGVDRFHFDLDPTKTVADQIRSFQSRVDKIVLHDDVFASLHAGRLDASMFVVGAAARDGNDHIIYNQSKGELYYDADGSGAGAAVMLAQLLGNPALTAGDFTIVG